MNPNGELRWVPKSTSFGCRPTRPVSWLAIVFRDRFQCRFDNTAWDCPAGNEECAGSWSGWRKSRKEHRQHHWPAELALESSAVGVPSWELREQCERWRARRAAEGCGRGQVEQRQQTTNRMSVPKSRTLSRPLRPSKDCKKTKQVNSIFPDCCC